MYLAIVLPTVGFDSQVTLPPVGGAFFGSAAVFPPDYVTADGTPVLADGDYVTASE